MAETEDKIAQLEARLDSLVRTQISFQQEVTRIADELKRLRGNPPQHSESSQSPAREYVPPPRVSPPTAESTTPVQTPPSFQPPPNREVPPPTFGQRPPRRPSPKNDSTTATAAERNTALERFIGENLISKIGIIVLIIGVAIGAKYAIDRELISPAMRIAIGYAFGFGLLGLALWLKPKYLNFSAVLMSGAVAVLYFITFFAYNLYGLIPQPLAFGLMICVTAFAVAMAILYSRQVIAHLGLVGAYAIPFLLSSNSGNYAGLFGYIAVINVGILAISVKRYWKALFYTTFVSTWLIFAAWYLDAYQPERHFELGFVVLTGFFAIFYATFLAYKLIAEESMALENVALVLSNSFVFFGFGLVMLGAQPQFAGRLGLFAVANAAIHFAVALGVGRLRRFPADVTYLMIVLIVTFGTIAVPLQLGGNWILLVWTLEAAMLFAIGRTKGLVIFEFLSYPLMILASLTLARLWLLHEVLPLQAFAEMKRVPIANGPFFAALLFAVAFGLIFYVNRDQDNEAPIDDEYRRLLNAVAATVALGVLYNALRIEIADHFLREIALTARPLDTRPGDTRLAVNQALLNVSTVWQINFTMLFVSALSFLNMSRWKSSKMVGANIVLTIVAAGLFVTVGLYALSEPHSSWFSFAPEYFAPRDYSSGLRYLSYIFFAGVVVSFCGMVKQEFAEPAIAKFSRRLLTDAIIFIPLFLIGSSEVTHLGRVFGLDDAEKFGLSIFWGIYALALIALGISLGRKHLRIGGFFIFAITLLKVFLVDISGLGTIPKMIVFVALGGLLLGASFLYTKYKTLIFGDED